MSRSIRPEVRRWGPHSSLFLDPGAVEEFFDQLASFFEAPGIDTRDRDAESAEITIQDGRAFLAGLRGLDNATATALTHTEEERLLLQNLRSLTPEWEPFLDEVGELVLVVDL